MVTHRKLRSLPRARRNTEPDAAIAQRDRALDQLRAVLKLIDRRAFMGAKEQDVVRTADALVAESERW